MSELPTLHTVADVAAALGVTEYYVKQQCRKRLWPHRKLARGAVAFTASDFSAVVELCAAPAAEPDNPRFALAPRSRRAS